MKKNFTTFYKPDEEQFKDIWNNCIFVFDANALLNLYRYSQNTKKRFMNIIQKLSERVWLPHQVVLEYHSNRVSVIQEQTIAYDEVIGVLTKASDLFINNIDEELKSYKKRHPTIEVETIMSKYHEVSKEIYDELKKQQNDHPDYLNKDNIRNELEVIFDEKVGDPFSQENLDKIYKEGEMRYKQKRPPGYKDAPTKKNKTKFFSNFVFEDQYGDLVVWKQIIEHAIEVKKPIIFITDDVKEDWWERQHGKTVGPRFELIDEFFNQTKNIFYMYESYRFMEYAQSYLNQQVDQNAIDEILQLKLNREPIVDEEVLEELEFYSKLKDEGRLDLLMDKRMTNYFINDKILHERWGVGHVQDVKGIGRNQEIKVYFRNGGAKRLLADFAPIKKIKVISNEIITSKNENFYEE